LSLCSAFLDGFREVTGRLSAEIVAVLATANACTTRKEHVSLVGASYAVDDSKRSTAPIGKQAIDALSLLGNLVPADAHHAQPGND